MVSVVIPMHNAAGTILRAIESVARQAHRPLEVIVVENNSQDESVRTVLQAKLSLDVRLLECPSPGSGAARNMGILHARGTHVAFLDADDVWYPNKLEAQVEHIQSGAKIVGSYFDYLRADGSVMGNSVRLVEGLEPAAALRAAKAMPAPMSSLVIDKGLIDEVGLMDVSFLRAQDFEWLVRLAQRADLMIAGESPLVGYVMAANSATATGYVEQALAAELVRLRHRTGQMADYRHHVIDRLASGRYPRRIAAAQHYRQAGIAWANGNQGRFLTELLRSSTLAPFDVLGKLRRQSVRSGRRSSFCPVADLFVGQS